MFIYHNVRAETGQQLAANYMGLTDFPPDVSRSFFGPFVANLFRSSLFLSVLLRLWSFLGFNVSDINLYPGVFLNMMLVNMTTPC